MVFFLMKERQLPARSRRAVYHPISQTKMALRRFCPSASPRSSREPRKTPADRRLGWCRPLASFAAPHRTSFTDGVAICDAVTAQRSWQPWSMSLSEAINVRQPHGAPLLRQTLHPAPLPTQPRTAKDSAPHRPHLATTPSLDMRWVDCHIHCRPLGRQWPWWPLVRLYLIAMIGYGDGE